MTATPRKRAIKLWVSPAMFVWLVNEARRREWSVPHVVSHAIAKGAAARRAGTEE